MHNEQLIFDFDHNQSMDTSIENSANWPDGKTQIDQVINIQSVLTALREGLSSGLATLAIGTMMLGGVYLFLCQLAETGW